MLVLTAKQRRMLAAAYGVNSPDMKYRWEPTGLFLSFRAEDTVRNGPSVIIMIYWFVFFTMSTLDVCPGSMQLR
jgi:hypothetical protein